MIHSSSLESETKKNGHKGCATHFLMLHHMLSERDAQKEKNEQRMKIYN